MKRTLSAALSALALAAALTGMARPARAAETEFNLTDESYQMGSFWFYRVGSNARIKLSSSSSYWTSVRYYITDQTVSYTYTPVDVAIDPPAQGTGNWFAWVSLIVPASSGHTYFGSARFYGYTNPGQVGWDYLSNSDTVTIQ